MELVSLDRGITIAGFAIAIWQLWKTKRAAEAARDSAGRAVDAVRRFEAATKMYDIASRSRELLRLLRTRSLNPAASAAFELRDAVARYRHDEQSRKVVDSSEWDEAVSDVRAVHERLESLAMTAKAGAQDRELLLHEVSRLHTLFTGLAAKAAHNGAGYDDPV